MNLQLRLVAAICASLLALAIRDAAAHPGHSHRKSVAADPASTGDKRAWTDASGSFHWHGSFVAAKEGQVQIRQADDSLVRLNLTRLAESDQRWVRQRLSEIHRANESAADPDGTPALELLAAVELPLLLAQREQTKSRTDSDTLLEIAKAFAAFVKTNAIRTRSDDRFFYVESNGIPDHRMMVGITAWQQQVPIPQKYVGDNAWRIPLHPVPAKHPQSAKGNFLRGAIALAVNGIPIFNPLNNRGDDAYLFGELDEFGGHCGRADDYHYHIAPVHLEKTIGRGLPIAYALDGYPIYGYEDPDGSPAKDLDAFNGHKDANGNYHYHATKTYPYLNGGFYGEVTERDGQVDPQPRAEPVRPALPPMRGARITEFVETKPGSYRLTYDVNGRKGTISYTLAADGSAKFVFVDTGGRTTNETFLPQRRGRGGDDRPPPPRQKENPSPRNGKRLPSRNDDRTSDNTRRQDAAKSSGDLSQFAVTSSSLDAKGFLTVECTCDGAGRSPAVEWKNAPQGTKSFALSLWHTAPDREKSYWVVYNIPADVTKLASNSKDVGKLGLNDRRRAEYDPMCSKGPGVKQYHITVFALSSEPRLAPDNATRADLLNAIKDITLAAGTLDFQFKRKK